MLNQIPHQQHPLSISISAKTPNEFNIASFSDVHLGHHNTKTTHILLSLRRLFSDNAAFAALDMVCIPGDLFDRQLTLSDPDGYEIRRWMVYFLNLCRKHDVVLRILEGTPSHDWRQSKLFPHLNELYDLGVDVRHVTTLSVEHIDRFNIDVLYIPDEWKPTCEETWQDVQAVLATHQLSQVDYILMHGVFPHQMPKNLHNRLQLHNPEHYLSICRHYIIVGHIHFYSQYQRILSSGSTDRLSHGEEGPKGILRLTVRTTGNDTITFIENKLAKRYVTVACDALDADAVKSKLERVLTKLPEGSFIRIKCQRQDIAVAMGREYADRYYGYTWSFKIMGRDTDDDSPVLTDNRAQLQSLCLTSENIESLLMARIQQKCPTVADRCRRLLQEIVQHE